MQIVSVEEAVGMAPGYDVTEITPGLFKGSAFKKGHIVSKNDIPKLLNIGKKHVYVAKWSKTMYRQGQPTWFDTIYYNRLRISHIMHHFH